MTIKSVTMFESRGKQFKTLKEAIEHREGLIEEFFRQRISDFKEIPYAQRIGFIESILSNRELLTKLLDYSETLEQNNDDH